MIGSLKGPSVNVFTLLSPLEFNYLWSCWFWLAQPRYFGEAEEDISVFLLDVEVQEAVEDRVGAGRGHSDQVTDQVVEHHVL